MIKNNFKFTQDNYSDAYKEAARQGKPLVAIFGSFENNNSRSLIQGSLAQSGATKDAIYIYVDPTKCKDAALKQFANAQLAGGHNAVISIVFGVKPGQNGKPEPEPYTFRWQGADRSMVPSFQQAISQAQERMNGYRGQFNTGEKPPAPKPVEKPVTNPPARPDTTPDTTHRPHDRVNRHHERPVKPVPDTSDLYRYDGSGKKPAPATNDLYQYDGSGKKPGADQRPTNPSYAEFMERMDRANQIFKGDQNNPGYHQTHQQLTQDLAAFKKLVQQNHGNLDDNKKEQAIRLLNHAGQQLERQQQILTNSLKEIGDMPAGKARADQLKQMLKQDATCLNEPRHTLQSMILQQETIKQQNLDQAQRQKDDAQRQADQAAQRQRQNTADAAVRQAHDSLDRANRDSLKWNSVKEQEQARLGTAMSEARNNFPEINKPGQILGNGKFDLLDSGKAHAKMNDVRSSWSSDNTNHNAMANVAELQRMGQWRQLVGEATKQGPSTADQRQEQMLLFQGVTGAGKPFSGYDFGFDGGGKLQNHGAVWTSRCADAMVTTTKPGADRKLASTLVPQALCDNNVPEADKLRLLDGLKNLTTKDQTGNAPLTREQEIVILTQALKADRTKQFDSHYGDDLAPAHIRSRNQTAQPKEVTQYLKHDKQDQIEFQTALMKRLGDLKAVEAADALNVVKDHPIQAPLARVAEDQLARINPSVNQLRTDIISNPLLAPADRAQQLDADTNADPRADRRAAAVIRYFGNQKFSNANQPGFSKLTGLLDDSNEATTVRLAAASVLSDSQVPDARVKAAKFAADLFCAKDPVQQYKDDAGDILGRMVPNNQAREMFLSDGRVVVFYHGADGKITYANKNK